LSRRREQVASRTGFRRGAASSSPATRLATALCAWWAVEATAEGPSESSCGPSADAEDRAACPVQPVRTVRQGRRGPVVPPGPLDRPVERALRDRLERLARRVRSDLPDRRVPLDRQALPARLGRLERPARRVRSDLLERWVPLDRQALPARLGRLERPARPAPPDLPVLPVLLGQRALRS
jgi:hypothetical protein